MLDRKVFATGMEYLKAYYTSLKTDFGNAVVQKIWYNALNHIDDNSFLYLIQEYCKLNEWQPQSPTHLLNVYNDLVDSRILDIEGKLRVIKANNLRGDVRTGGVVVDWAYAIENESDEFIKKLMIDYKNKKIDSLDKNTIKSYLIKGREPLAIE